MGQKSAQKMVYGNFGFLSLPVPPEILFLVAIVKIQLVLEHLFYTTLMGFILQNDTDILFTSYG